LSTLTDTTLAIKAQQRLAKSSGLAVEIPTLVSYITEALTSLSVAVAYRDDCRELQKDVNVSCVNGTIPLGDNSILIDLIPKTGVLVINGILSKPRERYEDLFLNLAKDTYHHALKGRKIIVKNVSDGTLGTAGGAGGIAGVLSANATFTLADFPPRYDPEIVDHLVKIAITKISGDIDKGGLNVNLTSDK
jgi:hypothetical protein